MRTSLHSSKVHRLGNGGICNKNRRFEKLTTFATPSSTGMSSTLFENSNILLYGVGQPRLWQYFWGITPGCTNF